MTYTENIASLIEVSIDFEAATGAHELDLEDQCIIDILRQITDEDFSEIMSAMELIARLYRGEY